MRAVIIALLLTFVPAAVQAEGMDNLKAGANGLLTWWMDPFLNVWEPPDTLEELPGYPTTGRFVGIFTGLTMSTFRLGSAVYDIVFFPAWVLPVFSPPARVVLIEGVEEE